MLIIKACYFWSYSFCIISSQEVLIQKNQQKNTKNMNFTSRHVRQYLAN